MKTSETTQALYAALIECWKEFPNIYPGAEGYGYNYIDLSVVVDKAKKIMPEHGLCAFQLPESLDSENVGVTTRIIHTSGEWIEATVYAKPTNMKGVNQTQATGATITYLRRYGLLSALGATGDKDLDGRVEGEPRQAQAAPATDNKYANNPKGRGKSRTDLIAEAMQWVGQLPKAKQKAWHSRIHECSTNEELIELAREAEAEAIPF